MKMLAYFTMLLLAMMLILGSTVASAECDVILRGTPVVDGQVDDIYRKSLALETGKGENAYGSEWHDANGTIYFLHDDQYMYICAEINDDDVVTIGEEKIKADNPWQNDNCEFRLSFNGGETTLKVGIDAYGLRCYGLAGDMSRIDYSQFNYKTSLTETGYVIEVAIPCTEGELDAISAGQLGFKLQLNDRTADGKTYNFATDFGGEGPKGLVFYKLSDDTEFNATTQAPVAEKEEVVEEKPNVGGLIPHGDLEDASALKAWSSLNKLTIKSGEGRTYLEISNIARNTEPAVMKLGTGNLTGYYKISGDFKTAEPGEMTRIRMFVNNADGSNVQYFMNLTNEWRHVECYIDASAGITDELWFGGGTNAAYVQEFCIDNLEMIEITVADMPETINKDHYRPQISPDMAEASNYDPAKQLWDYEKEETYDVDGLIINQDDSSLLFASYWINSKDQILEYANSYKDTHITDFILCLNSSIASYPSDVWMDALDKYYQKEENGHAVDYSIPGLPAGAHNVYEVLGVDYFTELIAAFKEININPWLSIRMNDHHDKLLETSHIQSDFYYDHPELRRVQHHADAMLTDMDCLLDYAYQETRDYHMALIRESLERYDPYGFELDFIRETYLFKIGGEYDGIEVMNEFMREFDAVIKEAEERWGHEIKVAVRVPSDLQTCMDYGLDVMTWVSEGIVDQVSPSGHYQIDNDIPVRTWSSLLKPYGVTLAPALEHNINWTLDGEGHNYKEQTLEMLYGSAANMFSQGADKIYLFNFYQRFKYICTEADKVYVPTDSVVADLPVSNAAVYWNLINTIGSKEKLLLSNRRMLLTFEDTAPVWANWTSQLPVKANISSGKPIMLRLPIGEVPEGATVKIKIGSKTDLDAKRPTVYVNSVLCEYVGSEVCSGGYTSNKLYCWEVPAEAWSTYLVTEIFGTVNFEVTYFEAYITPAEK